LLDRVDALQTRVAQLEGRVGVLDEPVL
jgi:hypothetical protein